MGGAYRPCLVSGHDVARHRGAWCGRYRLQRVTYSHSTRVGWRSPGIDVFKAFAPDAARRRPLAAPAGADRGHVRVQPRWSGDFLSVTDTLFRQVDACFAIALGSRHVVYVGWA